MILSLSFLGLVSSQLFAVGQASEAYGLDQYESLIKLEG